MLLPSDSFSFRDLLVHVFPRYLGTYVRVCFYVRLIYPGTFPFCARDTKSRGKNTRLPLEPLVRCVRTHVIFLRRTRWSSFPDRMLDLHRQGFTSGWWYTGSLDAVRYLSNNFVDVMFPCPMYPFLVSKDNVVNRYVTFHFRSTHLMHIE